MSASGPGHLVAARHVGVDVQPGGAGAVDRGVEAGAQGELRRRLGVQDVDQHGELVERPLGAQADVGEPLAALRRRRVCGQTSGAGLHRDHREVVGHDVVQLAGDPGALLLRGERGVQLPFLLELGGALGERRGQPAAGADRAADEPRADGDEQDRDVEVVVGRGVHGEPEDRHQPQQERRADAPGQGQAERDRHERHRPQDGLDDGHRGTLSGAAVTGRRARRTTCPVSPRTTRNDPPWTEARSRAAWSASSAATEPAAGPRTSSSRWSGR